MFRKFFESYGIAIICIIAALVYVFMANAANAEASRPISIIEANWESGDGQLVVTGRNAGRRGTVKIYSIASNELLDTVMANGEGRWISETSPEPAPCNVRAVSHDTIDELSVLDAPANCDEGSDGGEGPPPVSSDTSINSTSRNGTPGAPVPEMPVMPLII